MGWQEHARYGHRFSLQTPPPPSVLLALATMPLASPSIPDGADTAGGGGGGGENGAAAHETAGNGTSGGNGDDGTGQRKAGAWR